MIPSHAGIHSPENLDYRWSPLQKHDPVMLNSFQHLILLHFQTLKQVPSKDLYVGMAPPAFIQGDKTGLCNGLDAAYLYIIIERHRSIRE